MGSLTLSDILITPQKRIPTDGGDVLHGLKSTDTGFAGFGEAYFSHIQHSVVKAWKCHTKMTMNLIVPVGDVKFVFFLENEFREEQVGVSSYARITVPPGIWFGFQGMSERENLILNIASIPHDPTEVKRLPLENIDYDWS